MPNRLINEKSPYLLMHANNPIDWYPWSEEAFEKAKREDKPIFLSIGYSSCHWCHVMGKESFEDKEVAKFLNENFVSIKVDREERPDIDSLYMDLCVLINNGGGWPLSVFLTPDKEPIFIGTYFPKESRANRIGFLDLLKSIRQAWDTKKEEIKSRASGLLNVYEDFLRERRTQSKELDESIFHKGFSIFFNIYDHEYKGFGEAPKFPIPHNIMFLLRYYENYKNENALNMAIETLKAMRFGGIYDQVGFGFHRYSVTKDWVLPHFEKMLYDNALLLNVYAEAFYITKDIFFKEVAIEIKEFLKRELLSQEGAFYSSIDADSEKEEGKFYLWQEEELREILDDYEFETLKKLSLISKEGNFLEEATRKKTGKNIIFSSSYEKLPEKIRKKLLDEREKRVKPLVDTKILTDWNSLLIMSLSNAYFFTKEQEFLDLSLKALEFIEKERFKEKELYHDHKHKGKLDDYAFLILSYLSLYRSTLKHDFLEKAIEILEISIKNFWDENVFKLSSKDDLDIPLNPELTYDGAIFSGNSALYYALNIIHHITLEEKYESLINKLTKTYSFAVNENPISYSMFLIGFLIREKDPGFYILNVSEENMEKALEEIRKEMKLDSYILKNDDYIKNISPYIKDLKKGKEELFVCKDFSCSLKNI